MTPETRYGLGPLGRRLLAAFILVALSSVIVLTLAALIGTARGLTAGEDVQREAVATAAASAAGDAYRASGGWAGADLTRALDIAAAAGGSVVVRDATGASIGAPTGMQGGGMGGGLLTGMMLGSMMGGGGHHHDRQSGGEGSEGGSSSNSSSSDWGESSSSSDWGDGGGDFGGDGGGDSGGDW